MPTFVSASKYLCPDIVYSLLSFGDQNASPENNLNQYPRLEPMLGSEKPEVSLPKSKLAKEPLTGFVSASKNAAEPFFSDVTFVPSSEETAVQEPMSASGATENEVEIAEEVVEARDKGKGKGREPEPEPEEEAPRKDKGKRKLNDDEIAEEEQARKKANTAGVSLSSWSPFDHARADSKSTHRLNLRRTPRRL
jgi:hypothetical protein